MHTELVMIRHGQSQANAGLSQDPDCCLSDLGQEQARAAAALILGHELDGFVGLVSPYQRARETAACITAATKLEFGVEPLIREWQWNEPATVEGVNYPMESVEYLADRLQAFLQKYAGRRIVLVSHAGPIAVLTQLAWGETPNPHASVENARPRWLKVSATLPRR